MSEYKSIVDDIVGMAKTQTHVYEAVHKHIII